MLKRDIIRIIEKGYVDRKKWASSFDYLDYDEYLTLQTFNVKSIPYENSTIIKVDNSIKYWFLLIPIAMSLVFVFGPESNMDIVYGLLSGELGAIYFALIMIPIFLVVPVYLAFAKFPHWLIDKKGIKVGKKEVLFTDVEFICFRVSQHQGGGLQK